MLPRALRLLATVTGASLLLGLFGGGVARAQAERGGRTSALSWVRLPGAEGCVGAPGLAAAVEARLERRVFVPPADAEVSVEGTVAYRPETKRFKASFRVADRAGRVLGVRDVEESAASCEALTDRFAFVLSVLIDPDAALGAPKVNEAATEAPPPPAVAPAAPVDTPQAERPPPRGAPPGEPWRWMAGADVGAVGGLVPGAGWALSGGAILTPPHWPGLRVKGSSFLPTSRHVAGVARAEIALVMGQLGICPLQLRRPPLGLTVCLDGLLGELSARGEGFPDSRRYGTLVGGVVIDVVAELALTKAVLLTLSPAFVLPLTRARLAYDDAAGARRTIFEVAPVGGSVALGLAFGSR